MANFKRGLCSKTLPVVRDFLCNTDVGRKIKSMPDLDICIRDNYLNIYKEGCSLLKFSPNETNREYEIHCNYISESVKGNKYVYLKADNGDLVTSEGKFSFVRDVLDYPNTYLSNYFGADRKLGEKHEISTYLRNTDPRPFLLDLEIAYSKKDTGDERSSAPRIDMACIDPLKNSLLLVEVKVGSDVRVRLSKSHLEKKDRDNNDPKFKVIEQMGKYKKFISEEDQIEKNITNSYRTIARNYIDLGLADRFPVVGNISNLEILERFACEGTVDPDPYLLLFTKEINMKGPYGDNIVALKSCLECVEDLPGGLLFRWRGKVE